MQEKPTKYKAVAILNEIKKVKSKKFYKDQENSPYISQSVKSDTRASKMPWWSCLQNAQTGVKKI